MKKTYETPSIEKIAFQYRDQVVAASGHQPNCEWKHVDTSPAGGTECENSELVQWNN